MALKCTILMASAMLAAAAVCLAADPPVERPVRSYSGRVQLHAAPTELELPRSDTPEKPELPDSLQSRGRGVEDVVASGTFGPYINPPTRRERDRDKKARNWILPPDAGSSDKKESMRTGSDDDEGWGWLANDVLEQQRKDQEEDEEAEAEEEMDISILPTERLMQQAAGTSGLLTDSEYMRPPSVALARAPAGIDVQALMAMDQESRSAQGSATTRTGTDQQPVAVQAGGLPAGPFTTPLDGSAAGAGSPWSTDARRENVLPQTTTLMGRSKPEASGMSALLADRSGGLPKSSALGSPGKSPTTPARAPSMSYSFESSPGSTWGQMPAATPGRGVFGSLEPPRSIGAGTQPAGGLGGGRSAFGSTPSQQGFSTTPAQSFPEPSSTIPSWRR